MLYRIVFVLILKVCSFRKNLLFDSHEKNAFSVFVFRASNKFTPNGESVSRSYNLLFIAFTTIKKLFLLTSFVIRIMCFKNVWFLYLFTKRQWHAFIYISIHSNTNNSESIGLSKKCYDILCLKLDYLAILSCNYSNYNP